VRAKKIAALLAATTILVALGVPAVANAAKPRRYRTPASTIIWISGSASGGFHFDFFGVSAYGSSLLLSNRAGHGAEESVNYSILPHGKRTAFKDDRLDLQVGRLGRFHARFVPTSTKTEKAEDGCTGGPTVNEKGFFVGSFAFRGERGYTTIHSHREFGLVTRQGATSCPVPTEKEKGRRHRSRGLKEQREREANDFRLAAGDADSHILFQGSREKSPEPEEGSPTTFQATAGEKVGHLYVSRSVSVFEIGPDAGASFLTPNFAEPIAEATLTPSAPFSGSATFHLEGPKTASWAGDLAVELPGLGKVPLTGSDIDAGLCKGHSHCTETLPEPLQLDLELGGGTSYSYFGGTVSTTVGLPARSIDH
jgi:hypothetical protein